MGLFDNFLGPGLWIKIGADTQGFDQDMAKVKTDLTQWRNETNANTADMAKWGAAIGATAAPFLAVAAAAYQATEKYGAMAQQLKDLSYQTGIGTDKLQQLQYAATLSGTSFDKIAFSVGQLNLKIGEAADKTSAAYKAFYELGVNPEGKTPDQVFDETAVALTNLTDTSKRAQLANDLYGKSWRELIPFMQDYIDKTDEISKHPTISPEDLKTLADEKIAIDKITSSLNLMIAKLVVAAEKTYDLAAAGTKIDSMWEKTATNSSVKEYLKSIDVMALHYGALPDLMRKVGDGANGMEPPLDSNRKTLKELADEAENAQRKMEDLAQSIIDTQLSMQGTQMDLNEQGTTYQNLLDERRTNELKISAQPDSSEGVELKARNKEIDKELARLTLQMKQEQQTLNKGMTDLTRNQMDLAQGAINADTTILVSLQTRVETTQTQYDKLNQLGLDFWSTQSALAQVDYQSIMDYAAEAANFAGSNPIIQKIVQLSASGYDIDPSPLPLITAPVLETANFSKILNKTTEVTQPQTQAGTGTGTGTGGGKSVTINVVQHNTGVASDGEAMNRALGKIAQIAGANGR
ncbi:MAG: hypothetical protein WC294_02260 [Methanoregula sp.]|jgi:hypothetical protein